MKKISKEPAVKPPARKAGDKPPPRKSIFLVDDHPVLITGLTELIESEPGLIVCGAAFSAEAALTEIQQLKPDLVITDLTLPGKGGLELIKDLQAVLSGLPVLVMSMHDETLHAERVLRAGARGYLMKESSNEKLIEAIRRVLDGQIYVSDRMNAQIMQSYAGQRPRGSSSPIEKLSDREFQVFQLMGEGKTTGQIAEQLHLSGKTVAVHRGHIKEKLTIESATELVRYAVRWIETQRGA
jgi:DNA-binding NarL/FixJ family response regulator